MKLKIKGEYRLNPRDLMRRVGYREFRDPNTNEHSYVKTLQPSVFYPRFHVYIHIKDDGFVVDIHLDQKQASYAGSHMHNAEYDGPLVEKELYRIAHAIGEQKR
jgi:hypothetical protein